MRIFYLRFLFATFITVLISFSVYAGILPWSHAYKTRAMDLGMELSGTMIWIINATDLLINFFYLGIPIIFIFAFSLCNPKKED